MTEQFAKHGVTLLMGSSLNGFEGKTVLRNIQTKSGERVAAGVAVVACGSEPNLDIVRNTPLSGPHGSPVTDYLETEEKGIYAVGDLAFYPDRLMGGMRRQTHWENAREQGLIVGANITGKKRQRYEQIPYFWTEMFDLKFDFVGDFNVPATRVAADRLLCEGPLCAALFPRGKAARHRALPPQRERRRGSQDASCASLSGNSFA